MASIRSGIGESMEDRYLFKGKRIDNGEWVQGNLVWSDDTDDDYKAVIIPTTNSNMFTRGGARGDLGFENWCRVDPSTICQRTGLKDKNGKLFLENDIMVAHLDEDYPEDETYQIVLWHKGGFYTKENGCEEISPIDEFDQEHFEVCGNIFDNKDLVESEEM